MCCYKTFKQYVEYENLFTLYLSICDNILIYFYNTTNTVVKTLINSVKRILKSEPVLNLKKVIVYRLLLEKLDKHKSLRH
jgi:hypothetical protein